MESENLAQGNPQGESAGGAFGITWAVLVLRLTRLFYLRVEWPNFWNKSSVTGYGMAVSSNGPKEVSPLKAMGVPLSQ
jgi:hypothetical protein